MTRAVNLPEFWEQRYQDGVDHWDLGRPTPVFARLAAHHHFPPGEMIVLGAGAGYDARLFAEYGFRVTAVDFAPSAVQQMGRLADPLAPVTAVQADIFTLPTAWHACFDYVLEYVTFCAIDPERRAEYAAVVANLLRPGGYFIDLAFPIGRRPGGPPFVVQPDEVIALFTTHGFQLRRREFPPESIPMRRGVEELIIMQKSEL